MGEENAPKRVELGLEDGYRFRTEFGGDLEAIYLDEPAPLGQGSAPNASALLAAAVGNCLSASLLFCLRRARVEVEGFHTEVEFRPVRNAEGHLRIGSLDVVLRPVVVPGTEGRFGHCVDIFEDYCVVTQSVRRGIEVTVRVEPVSAPPAEDAPAGA